MSSFPAEIMDADGDRRRGGLGAAGESEAEVGSRGIPCEQPCLGFRRYVAPVVDAGSQRLGEPRVVARKPLLLRLTKDIVQTYQTSNPNFKYSEALNPKRFLTTPHIGEKNNGADNANFDLILSVNFVLVNEETQQRYIVKEMLGQGTFGQVAKCWIPETDTFVAIKVIKSEPAYYHQALHEVHTLRLLNDIYDPEDKYHIVRMIESFKYQNHLCISFEKLGSNLFELLKANQLKGLSLKVIQAFSKQILQALVVMKKAGVIHCDLKPENILLCTSVKPPRVKVIDFGSACMQGQTVYSYIQSRHYRSPEVVLGYPYTTAIDMWSFGCIVAELFLGLPLFPGASEYDLLRRMIIILGAQPPEFMLREAKNTSKYFKTVASVHHLDSHGGPEGHSSPSAFRLLELEEFEDKKPVVGKWYFKSKKLYDIVNEYPVKKNLPDEELSKEKIARLAFLDFLRGLVEFDPAKRWTPSQAADHPFITGNPFMGPYDPPAATSYIPVNRHVTVDHAPGQGHWLTAGLSPQVSSTSRGLRHNSPHFTSIPYSLGGSFSSYSDTTCNRGSSGSYGDGNHFYGYFSPSGHSGLGIPMKLRGSTLGTSPDARAVPHHAYGSGFGLSPTRGFGPMSLGISPSQFTPPSTQTQVYGPTSPARGIIQVSPLGKAAALGQYNKKRNLCHPATAPVYPPEIAPQHRHGHYFAGPSYPENNYRGPTSSCSGNSSYQPGWTQQRGRGSSSGSSTLMFQLQPPQQVNSSDVLLQSSDTSDQAESGSSIPQPGDWDPNYSDELLLQDNSDIGTITSGVGSMRLMHSPALIVNQTFDEPQQNRYPVLMNFRTGVQGPNFLDADGNSSSLQFVHPSQGKPITTSTYHALHFAQNSTSRFRQPPTQYGHAQTNLLCDDSNHSNGKFPQPSYIMLDSHSPANSAFGSSSWGPQVGYGFHSVLPSSHPQKRLL